MDVFIVRLASTSEEEVPKLVYTLFLRITERHTPKPVECSPPLLQPNHLLNQYFKRHYDVNKDYASWPVHYFIRLRPPDSHKLIHWNMYGGI